MSSERKKDPKKKRYGVLPFLFQKVEESHVIMAKGSVLDFTGTAIVNAANEGCLSGGGVDGAVTSAGGPVLAEARRALPEIRKGVRCPTGDAKITVGGDLKTDYCIHAVGPAYWKVGMNGITDEDLDALLYSAYRETMVLGQQNNIDTLAFSLLSAGIFRSHRSLKAVLQIGLKAIVDNVYPELKEVYMVGFTIKECRMLKEIMGEYQEKGEIEIEIETNPSRKEIIQAKFFEHKKKRNEEEEEEEGEDMEIETQEEESQKDENKTEAVEKTDKKPVAEENMEIEKEEKAEGEENVGKEQNMEEEEIKPAVNEETEVKQTEKVEEMN